MVADDTTFTSSPSIKLVSQGNCSISPKWKRHFWLDQSSQQVRKAEETLASPEMESRVWVTEWLVPSQDQWAGEHEQETSVFWLQSQYWCQHATWPSFVPFHWPWMLNWLYTLSISWPLSDWGSPLQGLFILSLAPLQRIRKTVNPFKEPEGIREEPTQILRMTPRGLSR